jgi:hypothetical protein
MGRGGEQSLGAAREGERVEAWSVLLDGSRWGPTACVCAGRGGGGMRWQLGMLLQQHSTAQHSPSSACCFTVASDCRLVKAQVVKYSSN